MNNNEFISDEELSYNEWVANNLDYINQNKTHISVMKKLYMDGFAAGFVHKYQMNLMEQLEK
jgi:hypothetical protein